MKTYLISFFLIPTLMAQGPLTPPAGPAPTMKTLTQVEPRTDIATVPGDANTTHLITESGSYYLSSNISSEAETVIKIQASAVTLDLNGFTISRPGTGDALGTAILLSNVNGSLTNVIIQNGNIFGGGLFDLSPGPDGDPVTGARFIDGISPGDTSLSGCRVRQMHVTGCDQDGIDLSLEISNVVEYCTVRRVGGAGIRSADVSSCNAYTCGGTGISASKNVTGSWGGSFFDGHGISAANITNCLGRSRSKSGILCSNQVMNSTGQSSGTGSEAHGISATGNVMNSTGRSRGTGAAGINTDGNVTNSHGNATGVSAIGILSKGNITNSTGTSIQFHGISASQSVSHSHGHSKGNGRGILASTVDNCTGVSEGGIGIEADQVSNSTGKSKEDTSSSAGISSTNVTNSLGIAVAGIGIFTDHGTVTNSKGTSETGDGIIANIITHSRGENASGSNVGLRATIAIGCTASGGVSIVNRYNMP